MDSAELKKTKSAYRNMLSRCTDNSADRKYYYDRGIKVCERWEESFDNFVEDMKLCPENRTLDRIDNKKGYSKDNCRWASENVQSWNRDYGPYKGVSWYTQTSKWRARLKYGGKEFFLGYFDDKDKAKEVYNSHARIIDWLIEAEFLQ